MAAQSRSIAKADEDQPADEKLVAEAVSFIRRTLADTLYKGATTVGEFVLERFFGNDAERVQSKNPLKNASFRSLVDQCTTAELPISKTWLHNAVGVAVMRRMLPGAKTAFGQLPPSHQSELLRLREPAKVEKVAERAVEKKLSVRDLRVIVVKEVAKATDGETRGRPRKSIIVKTLDRSLKLFTLESGRRSFTKAQVEELSKEDAKRALKGAEGLVASLQKLIEQLEAKA